MGDRAEFEVGHAKRPEPEADAAAPSGLQAARKSNRDN